MGAIPDYESAIAIIKEQDERIARAEVERDALRASNARLREALEVLVDAASISAIPFPAVLAKARAALAEAKEGK